MQLQRIALHHSPPWKHPAYRLLHRPVHDPSLQFADTVDWRRQVLLLVHRGECPTGGYQVRIDAARLEGDRLRVEVRLEDPRPDDFVTMAITYPVDVAALPRNGLQGRRLTVVFESEGRELTRQAVDL